MPERSIALQLKGRFKPHSLVVVIDDAWAAEVPFATLSLDSDRPPELPFWETAETGPARTSRIAAVDAEALWALAVAASATGLPSQPVTAFDRLKVELRIADGSAALHLAWQGDPPPNWASFGPLVDRLREMVKGMWVLPLRAP